ncbi:TPA: YybS family protein [Clostridium botulinum]|nr:YybS family protein [Clostridium botulinum]
MYNKQNKTNSLVEAGLIVSLMVILIMFSLYLPVVGIFATFLLPIPIAVLYLRRDYKITLWAILVTGLITAMIRNPITAAIITISFGTIGFLLGYCIKKQKSIFMTIMILAAGFLLSNIMIILIQILFVNKTGIMNFMNKNISMIKDTMESAKDFYSQAGVPKEQLQQMEQQLNLLQPDSILKKIPGALIAASFVLAFLNYAIARAVLIKLGYKNVKPLPHISKIHVNVRIVTIVAIGLLIGVILKRKGIELGDYFLINSEDIFKTLLLIDGISSFIYYMKNKFNISKGILIFILFITVLGPLSIIYFYLGLMDIMLDFRKLDPFRQYRNNKSGEL